MVNGRLRYSKLGNQWLSDDAGTNQHHQQTLAAIPDDRDHKLMTTKRPDDELNVIPVVAKRKAIEDAKELESIRQGEEAMRKAMERKKKIEMVRRARQQAAAATAATEAATSVAPAPAPEEEASADTTQQDELSGKIGNTRNLFMSQIYRIMLIIITPSLECHRLQQRTKGTEK